MTAPYTQQNYADWKRRFPGGSAVAGLLGQAKQAAGIEDEPQPLLTPPFNPNAEQARLGRVDGIHQWTQAEMEQAPQNPADLHEHQRGLLGGIRHILGADRTAPEVNTLLGNDPSKIARTKPGILGTLYHAIAEGKGPQAVQQERALNMLNLEDKKKARVTADRQEAEFAAIKAKAEQMPVGPARSEFYARAVAEIMNNPVNAMQTAVGLREREFAPQRVTWTTVPMMVNGKQAMVMRSNDGQLLDAASGTDLREMGARMEPMPSNGSFATPSGLTGPNGRPMVMNNQTGRMEEAPEGVTRETTATGRAGFGVPAMRKQSVELQAIIDNAKAAIAEAVRYPDAFGLDRASETLNPRIDPKGNEARRLFGRVASITRHETFGAALTPTEAATARSWVGRTMDPADKIIGDLQNLLRWAEAKKADLDGEVQTLDRPAAARTPAPAAGGKTQKITLRNGRVIEVPVP